MLSEDKSLVSRRGLLVGSMVAVGSTEWFIVEYESDAYPPLESVERCLKNLRRLKLV